MWFVHTGILWFLCLLFSSKGAPVNKEEIFVAVKTCGKFHSERGESHSHSHRIRQRQRRTIFPSCDGTRFFLPLFPRNGFVSPLTRVTVWAIFLLVIIKPFSELFHHAVLKDLIAFEGEKNKQTLKCLILCLPWCWNCVIIRQCDSLAKAAWH